MLVELQAVVRKVQARRATSRTRSVMLLMVFMSLDGVGGLGLFVVEAAVEFVGSGEFGVLNGVEVFGWDGILGRWISSPELFEPDIHL